MVKTIFPPLPPRPLFEKVSSAKPNRLKKDAKARAKAAMRSPVDRMMRGHVNR